MKKKLLAFILSAAALFSLVTACDKVADNYEHINNQIETKAVGSLDYERNASSFSVSLNDIANLFKAISPSSTIEDITPVGELNNPFLYIVNLDDGWRIVASDKRMPPILAYSDEGRFSDNLASCTGISIWFEEAENQVNFIREENALSNEYTDVWNALLQKQSSEGKRGNRDVLWTKITTVQYYSPTQSSYGPYVTTIWGQGEPWNRKCPIDYNYNNSHRSYTGCVSVAISQLLYYYHHSIGIPSGLYESIDCSNVSLSPNPVYYNGQLFNFYIVNLGRSNYVNNSTRWNNMLQNNSNPYSGSFIAGYDNVMDLMMDVGDRVNMQYSYWLGSGATDTAALSSLGYYGLTGSLDNYTDSLAIASLSEGKPLCAFGKNSQDDGHAWVLDGYIHTKNWTRTTYLWRLGYNPGEGIGEMATQEEAVEFAEAFGYDHPEDEMTGSVTSPIVDNYYFHMNWGWDGVDNGNYMNFAMFNMNREIIHNIHASNQN